MPTEEFLEAQRKLQTRIGVNLDGLCPDSQIMWTKQFILCMLAELAELLDSMPWKHWKKNQSLDIPNIKVELIDLQHFLNNLYIIWGMDSDEIRKAYLSKHKENINRQERGY